MRVSYPHLVSSPLPFFVPISVLDRMRFPVFIPANKFSVPFCPTNWAPPPLPAEPRNPNPQPPPWTPRTSSASPKPPSQPPRRRGSVLPRTRSANPMASLARSTPSPAVASLMHVVEPSHLNRPPVAEKEKITWEWLPFTSSARSDNLQLHHWARDVNGVPPTGDYLFANSNKSVDILKYTDEEYEKHLTDPVWTKEETDQLFDLCERFDLRFVVIADRFQPSRSMEDLKSRYYAVTRALLIARAPSFADVSGHPLVKETYNATNEIERKRALSFVLSQTREQERRNLEIVAEAKRILESRRASKSAEDVELPINTTVTETAEKANGPTESVSPLSNIRPTTSTAVPPTTTVDSAVTPASLRNLRVYLRTHVLEQMVQEASSAAGLRTIKRVEQTLQDLGVHVKPKVPTKAVCAEHLELRKEILMLLNLQKQLQNKEAEASGNRESSYTEMPDTPKRSFRGDIDRPLVPDGGGFGGERVVKRDHKCKVPLRKMKASE